MPRPVLPRLLAAATAEPASDADLLRRFARTADGAAFELVVRRHAAAVWAACRRILPDADAEDAFQATFLVLARKAGAVRAPSAGGWLHRVAVTAALKRKAASRRHPTEPLAADPPDREANPFDTLTRTELAAAVHEELARLPDRYRLPVVLCDLEGETQPAAAARLGWPVGSVAGRLSRARALLRDRLTRRGFAPVSSVIVLPFVAVPAPVVSAAVAAATGAVVPAGPVSLLATGVLSAMRTAKMKLAGVVLVSAGLVAAAGFGAVTVSARAQPSPPDAKKDAPPAPPAGPAAAEFFPLTGPAPSAFPDIVPPAERANLAESYPFLLGSYGLKVDPADDMHAKLLKARLHQYRSYLILSLARIELGHFAPTDYLTLLRTCDDIRSTLDVFPNATTRESWLVDLVRLAKSIERQTSARVTAGTDPPQQFYLVTAHRLGLEAALWKHRNPGKAP